MKQSNLFTKTRKEAPKDEESKNAKLLIRAGFVHKEMAGVYDILPLGLRVMNKIENIIREEMNALGGQELHLSALQDKGAWEKTDRWDDKIVDVWFKTKLKNDSEVGLGVTHEEPLTNLLKDHIRSYKDLPSYLYQFQTKFRNEVRAKSGMMRGREFLMKDLYSFSINEDEHNLFYEKVKEAYTNIFNKVGLGDTTYLTLASGGSFSQFSHEFQTLSDAGEDTIFVDENKKIAINDEVMNENTCTKLGVKKEELVSKKSIEVGNIFTLGTKFSEALELKVQDEDGKDTLVFMGSYGIGVGRLMGTIVETFSDEKGIIWPESVAPFDVHILLLATDNKEAKKMADDIYKDLNEIGVEVLYDDRDTRSGDKFNDAELMGLPYQIIIGNKTVEEDMIEVKNRTTGEIEKISYSDVVSGEFLKR